MISIRDGVRRTLILLALLASAGSAAAQQAMTPPDPTSVETAALPRAGDADEPEAALPRILGRADVALYSRIFTLQRPGDWRAADSLIARLGDPLLLGHVLYQRYMHPTKYRSKYKELKAWMQAYADHPGARRVYRLALRRQPKNWRAPRRPVGVTLGPAAGETDAEVPWPLASRAAVDAPLELKSRSLPACSWW